MKLTAKLTLAFSVLSLAVLGAAMGLLYHAENRHLLNQVEQAHVKDLQKLVRVCADSVVDDNVLARLAYLKTIAASWEPGLIAFVVFLDEQGRVLLHSDFLKSDFSLHDKPLADGPLSEAASAVGLSRHTRRYAGREVTVQSSPVMVRQRRVGTVAIAYDQATLDRLIGKIQKDSLWRFLHAMVWGIALSLVFATVIVRTLLRPIRSLSLGTRMVGKGLLSYRIATESQDELGDLAREFNAMAQRLGELDKLKDNFLAKISHDLRNPLSAILGYGKIMLTGMQGPVNEEQMKSLQIITQNTHYLSELIDNILDLTKLEAGKIKVRQKPVPLKPCAKSVIELLQVKADEYGVRLNHANVPPQATVWADEDLLRRVLTNLVANALKFTPKNGQVFIEWTRQSSGDRIAVRDTGIGIPEDKIHTLFQKFAQIDETRDVVRATKGTGLGLVICKELVEAHGGQIGVESRYRHGTTFSLTLPLQPVDDVKKKAPVAVAAHLTGE
jgi:signal transduction histidine kinase